MKKIYFVISFFFFSTYICFAQQGGQRIEEIKIGYITRELNLTSAESRDFWPAYNGYVYEIKRVRAMYPNDEIAFGEARLNIQKKYRSEFKRILGSDDRVNQTFLMEAKYREMLRLELINRQRSQQLYRQNYPPPVIRRVNPPVIVTPGKRY
jgi:hypothetical protein